MIKTQLSLYQTLHDNDNVCYLGAGQFAFRGDNRRFNPLSTAHTADSIGLTIVGSTG